MRILKIALGFCLLSITIPGSVNAQTSVPPAIPHYPVPVFDRNDLTTNSSLSSRLWTGVQHSFNTWDLPIAAASVMTITQQDGHIAPLERFGFDSRLSLSIGRTDNGKSLGSMSPIMLPLAASTVRLSAMLLIDAVSNVDYSPLAYEKLVRFHKALLYTYGLTSFAKNSFPRTRPDGSTNESFFSGHTSITFATSTYLYLEAKDFIDYLNWKNEGLPLLSPQAWKAMSFAALYGWAGYVGYSRMRDRRHYVSDVVVGALAGTAISYLVYPKNKSADGPGRFQFGVQPTDGGAAVGLQFKF